MLARPSCALAWLSCIVCVCVLACLNQDARAQNQIAPNPNPVGHTITTANGDFNAVDFGNDGTIVTGSGTTFTNRATITAFSGLSPTTAPASASTWSIPATVRWHCAPWRRP